MLTTARHQGRALRLYEEYLAFIVATLVENRRVMYAKHGLVNSAVAKPAWPLTSSVMLHFLWWLKMPRARLNVGTYSPQLSLTYVTHVKTHLLSFIEGKEAASVKKGEWADPLLFATCNEKYGKWLDDIGKQFDKDKPNRQTPLPAMAILSLVRMLDPMSVADLIVRGIIVIGFTCLLRPNSHQLLKWKNIKFERKDWDDGSWTLEVTATVPDLKSVGYSGAIGEGDRIVFMKEHGTRDVCPVRILATIAGKMNVLDPLQAWTVKRECLDMFVFPAVERGILTPHRTVRTHIHVIGYFPCKYCECCCKFSLRILSYHLHACYI